jgi:hypothetical protein
VVFDPTLDFALRLAFDLALGLLLDFFLVLAMLPPVSIYGLIVHAPLRRLKLDGNRMRNWPQPAMP